MFIYNKSFKVETFFSISVLTDHTNSSFELYLFFPNVVHRLLDVLYHFSLFDLQIILGLTYWT